MRRFTHVCASIAGGRVTVWVTVRFSIIVFSSAFLFCIVALFVARNSPEQTLKSEKSFGGIEIFPLSRRAVLRTDLDTTQVAPEDARVFVGRPTIWSAWRPHLATRKRGLLSLKGSRFETQSQRDCASKPRVARNELPWVKRTEQELNPNGVAALCDGSRQRRWC